MQTQPVRGGDVIRVLLVLASALLPGRPVPGAAAPADPLLKAEVKQALDDLNKNYGQAGSLSWDQAKALIAQREKVTTELMDRLARLGPGGARAMAAGYAEAGGTRSKLLLVRALGKINDAEAASTLQGLLTRDESFSLRKEMVVALGQRPEPLAGQALASVLANSDDAQLRFASAQALAGRPSALSVLAERLRRDPSLEVRKELIRSVGLVKMPAAMSVLAGVAQAPSDVAVRQAAIQELSRSFSASALDVLRRLLDDSDESIRKTAAMALVRVNTP